MIDELIKALEQSNDSIAALMPKHITPENEVHLAAYNTYHYNRTLINKAKEISAAKHRQYSAYLSNGGTMSMEEWVRDGRWDKSNAG